MIISKTPLRVSFVGGGTDLPEFYQDYGGAVLSAAIDKYIYVILKERFDRRICINYSRKETVEDVEEIQHELVREAMRRTGVRDGIEITTLADIPSEGSGLGSSSAVTVGLLNALYAYQGQQQPAERLAQEACEIEIDTLKKPIGKQDQYIAAYGGVRLIRFRMAEGVEVIPATVNGGGTRRLADRLLLFFTGRTRRADEILTDQRANIPDRIAVLKDMRDQAEDLRERLEAGDLAALGLALARGWELKKRLSNRITCDDLDELYARARAAGAVGGKIAGAGGGGFLLLYCEPAQQARVRQALSGLWELEFGLERDGSKIIFNIRS